MSVRASAPDAHVHADDVDGDARATAESLSVLARVDAALAERGVPAVVLRAPGLEPALPPFRRHGEHDVHLLVDAADASRATDALDALDWRLALGGIGAWRRVRAVAYHWDGGPSVVLHRGVSAAPLAPLVLRRLERALWSGGKAWRHLRLAPASSLAVFAATQAARPTPLRDQWLADVRVSLGVCDPADAERIARSTGTLASLRAAASAGRHGASRGHLPLLDGALGDATWRAALAVRGRLRPWSLRALASGLCRGVGVPARSRFAGIEVLAAPGVFVAQAVSEPLAEAAIATAVTEGVVVDVGTGCGAVALAVAARRPDLRVFGCDLSRNAIRSARRNARRLGLRNVRFAAGSLLDPLPLDLRGRVDVIVANVPYVPPTLWGSGRGDPSGTILGAGYDGLELQRALAWGALEWLRPGGALLLQLTADQWSTFEAELVALGYARGRRVGGAAGDVLVSVVLP